MKLDWLKVKEWWCGGWGSIVNFLKQLEARGHKTIKESKIKVEISEEKDQPS